MFENYFDNVNLVSVDVNWMTNEVAVFFDDSFRFKFKMKFEFEIKRNDFNLVYL